MAKCAFCGIEIPKGTGKMFVYANGKIIYFCKSKCEKNLMDLKRKPLTVKWTEYYRKEHRKVTAENNPEQPEAEAEQKAEPKAAKGSKK